MMGDLNWIGRNAACELSGAVASVASLAAHWPDRADALRAAVIGDLDEQGREFLRLLGAELGPATQQVIR